MTNHPGANRVMDLVDGLLDRGYDQATAATLRAIGGSTTSGIVAQRLNELDTEVARLAESGQRLTPDNPVLRALLADLEPVLRRDAARVDGVAEDVQASGTNAAGRLTRELSIGGMTDRQLMRLGVQWNTPDPEVVARAVGYVQSEAFAAEIARYPQLIMDTVRNQAVRGIVEGWNPTRTAREIRRMTENLPAHQANTIMRTLQLTSYREGNALHQLANADILSHQIRIGTLDSRVCMACLALHGTRLAVGERVDDHHNGRCTSIAVVKGVTRNVATGEQWFNGLPEDQRRQMAGNSAFDLLESGRAQLRDFVATYEDPVYGRMVRQASLASLAP